MRWKRRLRLGQRPGRKAVGRRWRRPRRERPRWRRRDRRWPTLAGLMTPKQRSKKETVQNPALPMLTTAAVTAAAEEVAVVEVGAVALSASLVEAKEVVVELDAEGRPVEQEEGDDD